MTKNDQKDVTKTGICICQKVISNVIFKNKSNILFDKSVTETLAASFVNCIIYIIHLTNDAKYQ